MVPLLSALEAAKESSLDLVQVSPSDANPVVCKLLDYGKHLFDKKKSISASKSKVKRNTTKAKLTSKMRLILSPTQIMTLSIKSASVLFILFVFF